MNIIEINNVCEKYRIKFIIEEKVHWEEIWALENINLKVEKGEVLGVIGQNGAGKTTLLKLIAGMLIPDKGKIDVLGKVSTLMELGAGFNPEFTGRENIMLNARMYGLDEDILEQQMEKIVEFAGLGKFMDAPVKYYSQGMYMRLAFALAIFVEPDILLIDDILAVGDREAQQKCIKKVSELKEMGKTIILVSHDMGMISKLCNRVMLIEKGKVLKEGIPQKVIQHYLETVGDKEGIAVLGKDKLRVIFNNGRISLSYDNDFLTKGMGGYVVFLNPSINSWFSSFNLSWQIKSLLIDKVIAEGRSSDGVFSQLWTLQLINEGLKWKVEIKEDAVKEARIDLVLLSQYKKWSTLQKEEEFPPFIHRSNWQDLSLNNFSEGMLGVTQQEEIQSLPSVILEIEEKDSELRIFNTGYEQEARIIQAYSDKNKVISVNIKVFSIKDKFESYIKNLRQQFLSKQKAEEEQRRAQRAISAGNLRLSADLEHKAIKLYYKDQEITKGNGLHTFFLINKTWHDLFSAGWQIEKDNNTLLFKFFWKSLNLTQTWKLFFKDDNLLWQIDFFSQTPLGLEIIKFGLFLRPEYKTFFCGYQQDQFPEEFTEWHDLSIKAPRSELFGLRKENNLPAVTLKNKDDLFCAVQNSDENTSFRVLQLSLPREILEEKKSSFITELSLLEEDGLIDTYLREQEQQFLRKHTISLGALRLSADLEHKAIKLYYKDQEITKGNGLSSLFNVSPCEINLSQAQWHIDKISNNKLVLVLNYASLMLSQVWVLTCKDKNTLEIWIKIETRSTISLTNNNLRLELQDKYKSWKTNYEEGGFLVNQYINNIGPIRLKDNKISKIVLKSDTAQFIPNVLFEVYAKVDKHVLSIYKYKQANEECICLASSLLIPKKEEIINPGKFTYFKGKIVLGEDLELTKESQAAKTVGLNKNNLRLIFDRGRGKILYGQEELTTGLSLYTSVRSSGIWYDSSQAVWQVKHKDNHKIIMLGNWPYIPISQIWQIELVDKINIIWNVVMEAYEKINLEIEQTNIMLSPRYKTWIIPYINKKGEFIDDYTQDYDILPFRFWYGNVYKEGVGAINKHLPSMFFKCNLKDNGYRTIIENTDRLYNGRLLQYQKSNINTILPKKYTYFEGVIRIEPKS